MLDKVSNLVKFKLQQMAVEIGIDPGSINFQNNSNSKTMS